MKQVTDGVYCLGGMLAGRVYLIEDRDGLTLIDTAITRAGKQILREIEALEKKPTDVKRILITHAHPDHVGALPEIKRATRARVIASCVERPVIEGKIPIPRIPPEKLKGLIKIKLPSNKLPPTRVDMELNGGEVLPILGGLQAVATPGHAPGHLAFWQPERRLLFCGDVLFHLRDLSLPWTFITVDPELNKRSVKRIAELDSSIVCFGHGEPLMDNAAARVRSFAQRIGVL